MIKRGTFLIILLLVFILLTNICYANSINYNYNSLTNINVLVYQKSDNLQIGTFNTGSNSFLTITYSNSPPSSYYYTYHYKQTYLPVIKTADSSPYYIQNLIKQSNCKAQISSVNLPSSIDKDKSFIITVNLNDITSVFPDLVIPDYIPPELDEYYKADTDIKIYLDTNPTPIATKSIKISTTGNNIQFNSISISTTGNHNIRVESEVKDDQCSSYQNPQPSLATIEVKEVQQTCPTCSSPTSWTACINSKQNRTNYKCDSSTNYQCQSYIELQSCSVQSCTPLWICSEWSSGCNGQQMQTRTCTNSNNCNNLTNKPIETQSCTTQTLPTQNQSQVTQLCAENWICASSWSECTDGMQTRICYDQAHCGLDEKTESQECNESVINTKENINYSETTKQFNDMANATVNLMLSRISEGIQEIIKSNKFSIIILFTIIILIIIMVLAYVGAHKEKILKPRTKIIKSDKKPVKINDLMLSVIESLDADERELCYLIVENEGIEQEELQKKTPLTKTKLEIALTKLERRQVIKKREGDNPKVFFNDWLK